jgi:hypothetical protein
MRGLDGWEDKSIGRGRWWFRRGFNGIFMAGMHFMDSANYDLRRVHRCIIKYVTADGRLVSFCNYNAGDCHRKIEEAARLGQGGSHDTWGEKPAYVSGIARRPARAESSASST